MSWGAEQMPFPPLFVLVVEDDPADALLTREALETGSVPLAIAVVGDGVEAMDYLHQQGAYAATERPGLVLLDLNLPRKDGRAVLAEVKSDDLLCTIPVVVLSTSSADEDVVTSYRLLANAYVTKPVDCDTYFRVVREVGVFFSQVAQRPTAA